MFDCIIPNKVAQFGTAFTSRGILQLRRSVYKFSEEKIDPACGCPVCRKYSRGYLHHLTKTQEPLGWTLLGQHNIWFYHQLMREIRQSILEDRFLALYHAKRQFLQVEDMDNPAVPPKVGKERRPRTLGDYEVHVAEEGFASIRQISSGEIMHSHTPPMVEAKALYVDQSGLAERLRLPAEADPAAAAPLVIWDLGLGAAANAMAAIQCHEAEAAKGPVRPLRVISFESDLDSLRLAMTHKNRFEYLRHSGPDALLARGAWKSRQFPGLEWELHVGDFWAKAAEASARPDLVFFDFFSHKTDVACWKPAAFAELRRLLGDGRAVELFTYSASTAVRVALLNAGFHVAIGTGTGVKKETIVALTPGYATPCRYDLLGKPWLDRWRRSSAKFPEGMDEAERAALEARIEGHPQFA
jgi:queuine tRNA-ribosyltransferase